MSDSASRLPARPSLEQLRKQAKDLLKDVRGGDAAAIERVRLVIGREPDTPTLSDAQFVVAREYGFDHWPGLARHVDSVNPPGLGRFEALASELAEAYTSASVERIREINWTHGTSFIWYREADEMHRQLASWYASPSRTTDEAVADARRLVARMSGFDDWAALARSLSTVGAAPAVHLASPAAAPFYRVDRERNTIGVRGPLSDTHWETVAAVIEEQQLTGVWAPGSSDAALERLTRLPQLRRLYLGTGMSDDGLRRLARLPALEELSLGGPRSGISDRGLEVLRDLKQLRRFWMTWAPGISDAGIANLAACDRLEIVDLMGTPTGDGAVAALANKPFLRKVATGRLVTDAGTALLSQFPQFTTWHDGQIQYGLGSFDSEPTHLLLDGPFTDAGLASVAELDGLFGLNLFWHATGFSGAGLTPLARLSRFGVLGCSGERCDDAVMRAAAGIPNLRMMTVQDTVATDEGFVALSRSHSIEHIWGGDTPNLTGRGFAALASMPALRGLAIGFRSVDDGSLAMLPRFPALRTLNANGLADEGFRHVGRCADLEALTMSRTATDAATAHIAGLSKLTAFQAGETRITDRSLAMLATMTSLERVDVSGCAEITDAGVMRLAALPRLSQLFVGHCRQVTPAAAAAFAPRVRVRYSE